MRSKFGLRSILALAAGAWLACAAAPAWCQWNQLDTGENEAATGPVGGWRAAQAKAWIRAAGVGCALNGVDWVGESQRAGDAGGKRTRSLVYEIGCRGRFGFMVAAPSGRPEAIPCPALDRKLASVDKTRAAPWVCAMRGDRDGLAAIQGLVNARGSACTVDKVKWRGVGKTNNDLFELTCRSASPGYILSVSRADGSADLVGCLNPRIDFSCELTTDAERKAWLGRLIDHAGRRCGEARTQFAAASSESEIYEVRCGADGGFMVEADLGGGFRRAIDCKDAAAIGGGCLLK